MSQTRKRVRGIEVKGAQVTVWSDETAAGLVGLDQKAMELAVAHFVGALSEAITQAQLVSVVCKTFHAPPVTTKKKEG